jgi:hypothetical protein
MAKTLILWLIAAVPLLSYGSLNDWTQTERNLYYAYNIGSWIDYEQSKDAFKNGKYMESNPLFSNRPHPDRILAQKILGSYVLYKFNDSRDNRKYGLIAANIVQWGVVINHEKMGVHFNISW